MQCFVSLSSDELREFMNSKRFLFYGYMCSYWSCLFGHRPGVFANMTDDEVEEAKTLGDPPFSTCLCHNRLKNTRRTSRLVRRSSSSHSGVLLAGEVASHQKGHPSKGGKFVHALYQGQWANRNLNNYLQLAWKEMGLAGQITFTLIWSALATYVSSY